MRLQRPEGHFQPAWEIKFSALNTHFRVKLVVKKTSVVYIMCLRVPKMRGWIHMVNSACLDIHKGKLAKPLLPNFRRELDRITGKLIHEKLMSSFSKIIYQNWVMIPTLSLENFSSRQFQNFCQIHPKWSI